MSIQAMLFVGHSARHRLAGGKRKDRAFPIENAEKTEFQIGQRCWRYPRIS
jgi:hypothetical protein